MTYMNLILVPTGIVVIGATSPVAVVAVIAVACINPDSAPLASLTSYDGSLPAGNNITPL
jgi:hypothetical protein